MDKKPDPPKSSARSVAYPIERVDLRFNHQFQLKLALVLGAAMSNKTERDKAVAALANMADPLLQDIAGFLTSGKMSYRLLKWLGLRQDAINGKALDSIAGQVFDVVGRQNRRVELAREMYALSIGERHGKGTDSPADHSLPKKPA